MQIIIPAIGTDITALLGPKAAGVPLGTDSIRKSAAAMSADIIINAKNAVKVRLLRWIVTSNNPDETGGFWTPHPTPEITVDPAAQDAGHTWLQFTVNDTAAYYAVWLTVGALTDLNFCFLDLGNKFATH